MPANGLSKKVRGCNTAELSPGRTPLSDEFLWFDARWRL